MGAVAQWSEHLKLKQEAMGSIPSGCPGFFSLPAGLLNVDEMKDLWCSGTVRLLLHRRVKAHLCWVKPELSCMSCTGTLWSLHTSFTKDWYLKHNIPLKMQL